MNHFKACGFRLITSGSTVLPVSDCWSCPCFERATLAELDA